MKAVKGYVSGEVLREERFTSLFYMVITTIIAVPWVLGDEGSQVIC